jgi:hypothetical protein
MAALIVVALIAVPVPVVVAIRMLDAGSLYGGWGGST